MTKLNRLQRKQRSFWKSRGLNFLALVAAYRPGLGRVHQGAV